VKVEAIVDGKQIHEKKTKLGLLAKGGVTTYLDKAHAIAHNKVMIIDGQTVITGSFNFTNAAEERNAENLLIVDDAALAAQYTSNWQEHQKHSERYKI
jgi:phosphatidylserine/phosphatidylglycerophosphate/cardiolipin synthase-like enzyme